MNMNPNHFGTENNPMRNYTFSLADDSPRPLNAKKGERIVIRAKEDETGEVTEFCIKITYLQEYPTQFNYNGFAEYKGKPYEALILIHKECSEMDGVKLTYYIPTPGYTQWWWKEETNAMSGTTVTSV